MSTAQMSNEKTTQAVAARDGQNEQTSARRETPAIRPAVNVFEDDKGIVLTADLPGVSGDRLRLEIDDDTLLIEGEAEFDLPAQAQPLHAEQRASRYQRSFAISRELDTDAIEADMKNGVLKVFLPKRKEHQPRKIAVKAT